MVSELIINATPSGFRIALLQDKELVEYHLEDKDQRYAVGDVYLGVVKKIMPSLNACFVDLGDKKDAFLHYSDLGTHFQALHSFAQGLYKGSVVAKELSQVELGKALEKEGKIGDLLSRGDHVLVQVAKEPISTKGPRLSAEIALAGRYLILLPFSEAVSLSKRISNATERARLTRLIESIKPAHFGVVVRTAAEGVEAANLDKDLKDLVGHWQEIVRTLPGAEPKTRILSEMSRASSILRDMLSESFDNIVVDDQDAYEDIRHYIRKIAPDKERIVRYYQGKTKLFEHFGIEKQLKTLFGKTVSIETGGYLVVEHTEAMHVIDVNSGRKTGAQDDHEAMALQVNLGAAKEIVRQLRLRDMGGIIAVDFIDMKDAEHRRSVYQTVKDALKEGRAKTTVLPLSKFGVMQITRQRVRPEMSMSTQEHCPACGGTGKIDAAIAVSDQIERKLQLVLEQQDEQDVTLFVHPYLHAYFASGLLSRRAKWLFRYKKWVKLQEDSSIGVTEFKFINKLGEPIELDS